ncbi:type 4a pilus biogenesis protein PilO [Desulfitobacterium sp.]|uniref:type 4a pilus biogenesis protein PilO n=1 Tax=Desulfitobacterium sp. TaxID=49981 RepID=UPI002C9479FD|nr:type 4a pilus biogenesis protein PilO [Desulfitobacterium sp.]HVJ48878.1 type 4a pilus biogenesis protein PilO [Desulfitobacterium sp.]
MTYLFLPQWATLQAQSQELTKREAYYQKLQEAQSNLPQLQKEAQGLQSKMQQQSTQMHGKLDNAQLLVDLYVLAKQEGVNPQSLTFDSVQNIESYQEINMSFTCEGSPASVLTLIQNLQQGSSLRVAVRGVNLSTQKGVMKAELKLAAYSSPSSSLTPGTKPAFMKSSFGVDSPAKMFTP